MHGDAVRGGEVADGGRRHAGDGEPAVFRADGRPAGSEQARELRGPGRLDQDVLSGPGHELRCRGIREQPAAPDDDEVIGGLRHLAHQVAGDHDGATLGGHRPEQQADPADAFRVQPVDRLVEQQHRRIGQQRRRDAEPLFHAKRELPGPPGGDRFEPGQLQHLPDPALADAVALREGEQVEPGGAAGGQGGRVQQRANLVQRADELLVAAAAGQGRA